MWVRWLATVRSPRNSAAATSRFVRPSATRAATRRSAAVSPSSRVRPPMLSELAARLLDPGGRAELLEAVERRLDRLAGGALLPCAPADDAERKQRTGPAEGIPDALVLRDRLLQERRGLGRRPRGRRRRGRGTASRARAPTRGRRRAASASQTSRTAHARRRSGRARGAARRSRRSTSGRSARPTRALAACRSASPSHSRAAERSPLQSATSPEDRQVLRAGGARTAPRPARARAPSARGRARAGRDGRRSTAIGRWSCGTSSPYWIEMSCARAACSAASSQRPAQNSTQARPQSARALRGSSRSRHSRCSRSSRARASSLVDDGARVFTTASVASCTQLLAADGGREVVRSRRRCAGASASPANQPRIACTARARARSTSSSSSSASSSAARACSTQPSLKRVAHARRQWMTDWSAGREAASRSASSSSGDGTVDALELGEEDERLGAQRADLRLGQQVGRDRPRARPLAGGLMRTSRGQRSTMALVALVRRRQPERLLGELGRDGRRAAIGRQPRGVVERRPRPRRPARPSTARGDGRGGADRRRCRAIRP